MTIGELIVNLGFKADTAKLNDFIHDLGELNLNSIVAASGLGGVVKGIQAIMDAADKTALAFNNMSAMTGVSAGELQKWDKTAQEAGIGAGVVGQSINSIQSQLENLKNTGEGGGLSFVLSRLGKNPVGLINKPNEALKEILESIKGLPPATQKWYLQMAGLNQELLLMIPHLDEIDKQTANSEHQFKTIQEYHRMIVKLTTDWQTLIVSIATVMEPVIGSFVKGLDIITEMVNQTWLLNAAMSALLVWAVRIALTFSPFLKVISLIALAITGLGFISDRLGLGNLLTPKSDIDKTTDNSKDVTMHNYITVQGDDPQRIAKHLDDWYERKLNDADGQNPVANY